MEIAERQVEGLTAQGVDRGRARRDPLHRAAEALQADGEGLPDVPLVVDHENAERQRLWHVGFPCRMLAPNPRRFVQNARDPGASAVVFVAPEATGHTRSGPARLALLIVQMA